MRKLITLLGSLILILLSIQNSFAQERSVGTSQDHLKRHFTFFDSTLSGAQEVTNPAGGVTTDRRGRVLAFFDSGYTKMRVIVRLSSAENVIGMHFHCGRAGENGPIALGLIAPGPLSLQGNVVRGILTNSDVLGTGCDIVIGQPINNLVSLAAAMSAGLVYLNVHTTDYQSGEIRGQLGVGDK